MSRVSLRIVTAPIQSQGIITRDNVSVDVAAVAYYRVVGQHTLDETLSETASTATSGSFSMSPRPAGASRSPRSS